jgi:hypothetical protein
LSITGRDVEEAQLALSFSPDLGSWHLLDTPVSEITLGDTRRAVLHYVRDHEGARPKEISDDLELDYELTKKTCARMVKDGQLDSDGKGRHFAPISRDSAGVPAVPAVPAAGQSTFSQGHPQEQVSLYDDSHLALVVAPPCDDCGHPVDSDEHGRLCEEGAA